MMEVHQPMCQWAGLTLPPIQGPPHATRYPSHSPDVPQPIALTEHPDAKFLSPTDQ